MNKEKVANIIVRNMLAMSTCPMRKALSKDEIEKNLVREYQEALITLNTALLVYLVAPESEVGILQRIQTLEDKVDELVALMNPPPKKS